MYSFSTTSRPGELTMEYMRHETTRSGLIVAQNLGRTILEVELPRRQQLPTLSPAVDTWLKRPYPNHKRQYGPAGYNGETIHTDLGSMLTESNQAWRDIRPHISAVRAYSDFAEQTEEGHPVLAISESGLLIMGNNISRFIGYTALPDEISAIEGVTANVAATIDPGQSYGGYI
jgi:hypothetical protein